MIEGDLYLPRPDDTGITPAASRSHPSRLLIPVYYQ